MTWMRLCSSSELPQRTARAFRVRGIALAAARSGDAVFVLEDRCSHDDGPLGEGRVSDDGREIECPRHGARFDLATGRATRMPAISPITAYAAKVAGDDVLVDIPEDEA